jgi:flagellar hook assembly protein FlgD
MIYFKAKRASGDTTHYDNYAGEEPFFLVRNNNDMPLNINNLSQSSNTTATINKVNINQHIEKESEYSFGDTVYSHYTLPFEGWYWDIFDKFEKPGSIATKRFYYNHVITPADEPLSIRLKYNTQLNYDASRSDFGIAMRLNGEVHDSVYIKALGEGFFENNPSDQLYPGGLTFDIRSHGYKDDIGRVGVDYIEISGNVIPFAHNGSAEFSIPKQASDFRVVIPGFSGSSIVAYDTLNNAIAFFEATQGTSFRINAKNEDVSHTSVVINDSIYSSDLAGLHIASLDSKGLWKTEYFAANNDAAANALQALSAKSFAVTINQFPISDKIRTALNNLGAKNLPNGNMDVYCLYGAANQIKEKLGTNNLGVAEFIDHSAGLSYKAELKLKANTNYHFILENNKNIDNTNLYMVEKPDLLAQDKEYKAIVLTHTELIPSAIAYKNYREAQNIDVKIVDVNNIYNFYNYGKKSPYAIKEYLADIYNTWNTPIPTHVIIIGDASWDNRNVMGLDKTFDFVPAYGWPVTDYWYVTLDSPADQLGDFSIGRIPVNNNQEMIEYIDKIRAYETATKSPWMKRFMHLSGGGDAAEIKKIYDKSKIHGILLNQQPLNADTVHIVKPVGDVVSEAVASKIKNEINNGVNFITFFGHGSPEVFDIEGWQVEKLNNQDRYFGLLTLACNAGAFAEPFFKKCRNESYVVAANKGAIMAVGGTGVENIAHVDTWAQFYWEGAIRKDLNIRNYGELVTYTKSTLPLSQGYIPVRFQTNFIGDPLVDMRIEKNPDPYLSKNFTSLTNEQGSKEFTDENETIKISGTIYNAGTSYTDSVKLRLSYTFEGTETTQDIQYLYLFNSTDFSFEIPIKGKPGKFNIKIEIDPEGKIQNDDLSNNVLLYDVDVYKRGLLPLEPLSYWNINGQNPTFRFINPLEGSFSYRFLITENKGDTLSPLFVSQDSEIDLRENFILWNSPASLSLGKNYWIAAKPIDADITKPYTDWLWIPVHVESVEPNIASYKKSNNYLEAHNFTNVEIKDSDGKQRIALNDVASEFYLVSIKGYNIDGVNTRWATVTVDNQTYVDIWSARGFNVVTYPKYIGGGSPRYKRFDCYRPDPSTDENLDNVYALHHFLRDSVSADEYLALATCDNSLAWQEQIQQKTPSDFGSLDTLKSLLKMYGATRIDSINSQVSYALFSWKGASPEEAAEAINMLKDSAKVEGQMTLYRNEGVFSSEKIGPAQQWNYIQIEGNDIENSTLSVSIFDTLSVETVFGEFEIGKQIDLSAIDASLYPYLSYKVNLKRNSTTQTPSISSVAIRYNPSPEMAIKKSTFELAEKEIMRGETNRAYVEAENISGRSTMTKSDVQVEIFKNQSLSESLLYEIDQMPVDAATEIEKIFDTAGLSESNHIEIEINPYKRHFSELYSGNNSVSEEFVLTEDTIRPTAVILADDNIIKNGSYISNNPLLELRVFDNSPLEFSEGLEQAIRLNGKYYTEDNASFYDLQLNENSEENLKAVLQVKTDTIKYEESLLIAYIMDATGNRDTIEYYLNTTTKSQINEVKASPNPFTDKTNIEFTLLSANSDGNVEIAVFSAEGSLVKRLVLENLKVGKNSIEWDGNDENGIKVPVGAYYFSVIRNSGIFTEESYGKLIMIK